MIPYPRPEQLAQSAASGRFQFWIADGEPVSMAGIMRRTRNAAAIAGRLHPAQPARTGLCRLGDRCGNRRDLCGRPAHRLSVRRSAQPLFEPLLRQDRFHAGVPVLVLPKVSGPSLWAGLRVA